MIDQPKKIQIVEGATGMKGLEGSVYILDLYGCPDQYPNTKGWYWKEGSTKEETQFIKLGWFVEHKDYKVIE